MTTYNFISKTVFLAFVAALVSCGGNKKSEVKTEKTEVIPEDIVELRDDQIKLANIETGTIEMRTLSGTLKVSGTVGVHPEDMATVSFPLNGFIKNTHSIPGTFVRQGQILANIGSQDFVDLQQKYLEAKNKFLFTEAEYNRHAELYKNDVSSQKQFQQITSEYKIQKAEMNALGQKLSLIGINPATLREDNIKNSTAVYAPISGYITAVNVNIGKSVSPSDVLFEIANSDKLLLELTLFEKDINKIANGQKVRFFVNNETEEHQAVIYQTSKSVNTDKTCKVYANVINRCKNVLPGMYVNASIATTTDKVTSVPVEAVVSFEDNDYIFIFEKDKVEDGKPFTEYRMIKVKKGITDDGYIEITLPDKFDFQNAKVVTKGSYNLLSAKKNAGEMAC